MQVPELLCIGFLCHDLHNGEYILGGTASYSSIMASHLGLKTAILTSVGEDFKFLPKFSERSIALEIIPSNKTTVFENIYQEGRRTQYLHQRATSLSSHHLPNNWQDVSIIKFCLIADEVDDAFLIQFPNALVAATIQGWLRQWDEDGKVSPKEMDWDLLSSVDIVFMSDEDIRGFEYAVPIIAEKANCLVMTKGKKPVVIHHNGKQSEFACYPVVEVDPTGAGDIFAASFLYQFYKTNDMTLAAAFAHASASCVVEKVGVHIPEIEEINRRYDWYLKNML
jgi:sugar/nucleoside kinase (ribokinase family)